MRPRRVQARLDRQNLRRANILRCDDRVDETAGGIVFRWQGCYGYSSPEVRRFMTTGSSSDPH